MYGGGRSELMQVYVQKSTSTTFPRSAFALKGGELSQPIAPRRSGTSPSSARAGRPALPHAITRGTLAAAMAGSAISPIITLLMVVPFREESARPCPYNRPARPDGPLDEGVGYALEG